jgi:uncharacterized protein (DUF1810 family)
VGEPFDPERFLRAQAPVWADVRGELRAGRKTSHWMWFIFPQLRGLGRSETAAFYGLGGLEDAAAYLAHPVLGARLAEVAGLMLAHEGAPAEAVLGSVDALKLRSSMTLFAAVPGAPEVFAQVLGALHEAPCERTAAALGTAPA